MWSGWFYKYRQVLGHDCGVPPLLNIVEASVLFRDMWTYGGPSELKPDDKKLLALATPYVKQTVPEPLWSAYLHGGRGIKKKPLVPWGTKRRGGTDPVR